MGFTKAKFISPVHAMQTYSSLPNESSNTHTPTHKGGKVGGEGEGWGGGVYAFGEGRTKMNGIYRCYIVVV